MLALCAPGRASAVTTTTTFSARSTTTVTTVSLPLTAKERAEIRRFIQLETADSTRVQLSVEKVLSRLKVVAKDASASSADVAGLANAASSARSLLLVIRPHYLRASAGSGRVLKEEREIATGVAALGTAMGTMAKYTSTGNQAMLALFAKEYNRGLLDWDNAIGVLWSAAGESSAPAIP
jgi:hypothetical protein